MEIYWGVIFYGHFDYIDLEKKQSGFAETILHKHWIFHLLEHPPAVPDDFPKAPKG